MFWVYKDLEQKPYAGNEQIVQKQDTYIEIGARLVHGHFHSAYWLEKAY